MKIRKAVIPDILIITNRVKVALAHPEIGEGLREYLKELVRGL